MNHLKSSGEAPSAPLHEVILVALLISLTALVTCAVNIPTPLTGGYTNLGDVIVICSGMLLGRKKGAFVGGAGSALADMIGGHTLFAPATLVIKGFEGYMAGMLGRDLNSGDTLLLRFVGGCAGALGMVGGYFFYERVILVRLGLLREIAAYVALLPNVIQGLAGVAGALLMYPLLKKAYLFACREN